MSYVEIKGARIGLFCYFRGGNNSRPFDVIIGKDNYISEFKKKPKFPVPSNRIKDINNLREYETTYSRYSSNPVTAARQNISVEKLTNTFENMNISGSPGNSSVSPPFLSEFLKVFMKNFVLNQNQHESGSKTRTRSYKSIAFERVDQEYYLSRTNSYLDDSQEMA
ncbi:15025_t:CDS:2, partial [Funneliformis geosporum]